jgi:hypothetical protein
MRWVPRRAAVESQLEVKRQLARRFRKRQRLSAFKSWLNHPGVLGPDSAGCFSPFPRV